MKRVAELYKTSVDGKRAFYIDVINSKELMAFLAKDRANIKKFNHVLELLLEHKHHIPTDVYDKENFEKGCEKITAIKLFKGKKNPRIYCQQYTEDGKQVFVIIASELLEKKKSNKLTNKEKSIIRRVASYQYTLKED
jgi:hypothetical protein